MKKQVLFLLLCVFSMTLRAQRKVMLLNDNWKFRLSSTVQANREYRVQLPHTFNAQDALSGNAEYYRGVGNYRKELTLPASLKGQRLYLRFEGANSVTNLFVNHCHVGEHRGGYGAFVYDITDFVKYDRPNEILVRVNNSLQLDVMPLVGDFNFYGGIYRDVYLIATPEQHISLTDYASSGIYLIQEQVTARQADVTARVVLHNAGEATKGELNLRVFEAGKLLMETNKEVDLSESGNQPYEVPLRFSNPRLWNGRKDPFCYQVETSLKIDGRIVDSVTQPLGLRFYHTDADQGFFLNGESLKLKGVCRHQDRAEVGNALHPAHHDEDMEIIKEMGANAIRLAHYPQATYFYDLADQQGMVVWAEIPQIGPGGYAERGYIDLKTFRENGKEQLRELIRQHYNHPSICFWGLFNELKTHGNNPVDYIRELQAIVREEDPTRPTTSASFLEDSNELNRITDVIAWNKYFGWYGGKFSDMGVWADGVHRAYPELKVGVSEYGAGASIYHQQDSVKGGDPSGWWHPENWQTAYHMDNWKAIAERPFIWGSFIWNLFDFGAAHRTEGDRPGINDKGLVTFDRKVKKDAFYFYKANWNADEPFVYIANRRHIRRDNALTSVMAFTNMGEAELFVNGVSQGICRADAYATCNWERVRLLPGINILEVRSGNGRHRKTDQVKWTLLDQFVEVKSY